MRNFIHCLRLRILYHFNIKMIDKEILMYKRLMPIDNQTSIKNTVNLLINLITNRYYFII